jgi:creatinine amidohydrolase
MEDLKARWRLKELSLSDLRKKKYGVAVLPLGATEPHNLHLPYGTDILETETIADRACELASRRGANVVLLPSIPFGSNRSTMAFPLTINVDHSTLYNIIDDVTESLQIHKIRRFVIINGHGGNYLRHILKDLYGKHDVYPSLVNWWEVGADRRKKIFEKSGDHADEMETSVMLYLFPKLVQMKLADLGSTRKSKLSGVNEGWVYMARAWELVTTNSGSGDPRKASAEKGKKYVDYTVKKLADYLVELSRTPHSKTFPY